MAPPRSLVNTQMSLLMLPSLALSKRRWDLRPSSRAPLTPVTGRKHTCLLSTRSLSTWLRRAPYCHSQWRANVPPFAQGPVRRQSFCRPVGRLL
jgi:hypothetical protein